MLKAIREIRTKIGAEIQHMHNIESCAEHSWGGRGGVLNYSAESSNYPTLPA